MQLWSSFWKSWTLFFYAAFIPIKETALFITYTHECFFINRLDDFTIWRQYKSNNNSVSDEIYQRFTIDKDLRTKYHILSDSINVVPVHKLHCTFVMVSKAVKPQCERKRGCMCEIVFSAGDLSYLLSVYRPLYHWKIFVVMFWERTI